MTYMDALFMFIIFIIIPISIADLLAYFVEEYINKKDRV